jgi:hypothetical protein
MRTPVRLQGFPTSFSRGLESAGQGCRGSTSAMLRGHTSEVVSGRGSGLFLAK